MRLLKNRALEDRWQSGEWDRALGLPRTAAAATPGGSSITVPPHLEALVLGPLGPLTTSAAPLASVDVDASVPETEKDGVFLQMVKAAFTIATRLEREGVFRVLVRSDTRAGGSTVTLRCFSRDDSHPRTPDEIDSSAGACVLFVDTRRIDGARRP